MNQSKDMLRVIFDGVSEDFDLGEYDDFITNMKDEKTRKSFYNQVSTTYDLGEFPHFEGQIKAGLQNHQGIGGRILDDIKGVAQTGVMSGAQFMSGLFDASADLFGAADSWVDYIGDKLHMSPESKGGLFKILEKDQRAWAEKFKKIGIPEDVKGTAAIARSIYGAAGRASFDIPVMTLTTLPGYSGFMEGAAAIDEERNVLLGSGKGLAHGVLMHKILQMSNILPIPEKVGITTLALSGESVLREIQKPKEERNWEHVLGDAFVAMGLSLTPSGQRKSRSDILFDLKMSKKKDLAKAAELVGKAADKLETEGRGWMEALDKREHSLETSPDGVTRRAGVKKTEALTTNRDLVLASDMVSAHEKINIPEKPRGMFEKVQDNLEGLRDSAVNMMHSVASLLDVEYKWNRAGGIETGKAVKNIDSIRTMHQEYGLAFAKKLARRLNFNKHDMTRIVFIAESPYAIKLVPEADRPRIKRNAELLNEYFKAYRGEYARRGVNADFKQRLLEDYSAEISRIESEIKTLQTEKQLRKKYMRKTTEEKIRKESSEKIMELKEKLLINTYNFNLAKNTNFTHIPTAMWFADNAFRDPASARQMLKLFAGQKRKTFRIADLVERGVLAASDVNAIDIIASYSRRVGRDLAMLDVVNAAKKDGLASSKKTNLAPGKVPTYIAPMLKDVHVNRAVSDWAWETYNASKDNSGIVGFYRGTMATVKMAQFYNPVILPMYDIFQGAMLGSMRTPWKAAKNIYKGFKSAINKDSHYWEAYENGAFAQNYTPPFDHLRAQFEKAKLSRSGRVIDTITHLTPKRLYKEIYGATHNLAWAMDEAIRLGSYHHLRGKGFTARDASQTVARFHGDYASVPAKTRNALNLLLFTPTFKVAMGKLYGQMISDFVKATGKGYVGVDKRTATYAKGFTTMLAANFAVDAIMQYYGFEVDEWGRKFSKTVETADGQKDFVITWSHPANMFSKYINRFLDAFVENDVRPGVGEFIGANKWELHPVYGIANSISNNQDGAGNEVYHPFEKLPFQILDVASFILKEAFPIINAATTTEDEKANRVLLQEEFGLLWKIPSVMTFQYSRQPDVIRAENKIEEISRVFDYLLKDDKINSGHIEVFQEKLKEAANEIEE